MPFMLICLMLFIIINGTFHHQNDFVTDVNLSYSYGNTFQPNNVWSSSDQPNYKNVNILYMYRSMCQMDWDVNLTDS
jgi:hypothetical protein